VIDDLTSPFPLSLNNLMSWFRDALGVLQTPTCEPKDASWNSNRTLDHAQQGEELFHQQPFDGGERTVTAEARWRRAFQDLGPPGLLVIRE
jgi:hypothetical protein